MKKLMYLLVAGSLSVFAACGGACATDCAKECCAVEEVVAEDVAVEEVATEEVVEAVGCQVEGGTCLADHSCCAAHEDEATDEAGAHEGHSHE
jgi:hypothetical protein